MFTNGIAVHPEKMNSAEWVSKSLVIGYKTLLIFGMGVNLFRRTTFWEFSH